MSLAPSYTTPQEVEDLQLRVSLSSSAGRINLWPNAKGDGFKLHTKVDGLGVADSVNTMTSLPSGGAVLRHQRLKEGDMFLPIQIRSNSKKARNDLKTKLEQILTPAKGPVKVEVMDPYTKDTRSRTTYYRTGLGAPDWSGPNSALYGITLDYAEPWWRGAVRGRKIKVADRKKPFITARARHEGNESEEVLATNLWRGSKLSEGRSAVSTNSWNTNVEQTDEGLEITIGGADNNSGVSVSYTNSAYRIQMEPGLPYSFSVPIKNTGDVEFSTKVAFYMTSGGIYPDPVVIQPGETHVFKAEGAVLADGGDFRWSLRYDAGDVVPPDGAKITLVDGATCVQSDTVSGELFNGSTYGNSARRYRWLGNVADSESQKYKPAKAISGVGPAIPFFPVFIYSSVVEGVYTLDIEGDEEVWPTWEIGGPGTDLLIENMTTGEALFIEGDIFEKITIVTDPQLQDIYSDTWTDGQWWDRVDIKQGALFPLKAGENKIKVTMVGATQASYVEYKYREIWGAPY